jgi:hypothetical protein
MEQNNNMLFVDWVYTFNPCVDKIRKIVSKKKIKQVILNRTNDGPKRFDTSSIHDLSSHDLSILYHVFGRTNFDFTWNEFSIKSNEEFGSNISWYYKSGLQVIINSSWQHKTKNRVSLFITEDDEVIVFDDVKKIIMGTVWKPLDENTSYDVPDKQESKTLSSIAAAGGIVNAEKAIQIASQYSPSKLSKTKLLKNTNTH